MSGTKTTMVAKAAIAYYRAGLTIIPLKLDGSKAPAIGGWGELQKKRPAEEQVRELFDGRDVGIAILGGATSGGLEIVDFETAEIFEEWSELMEAIAPGLVAKLPRVKTPNGFHLYFRSPCAEGNQVLARSKDKIAGKNSNVVIETRGEGGYVVAPPSPPSVHASGKPYTHAGGPKISQVPTITADERKTLMDAARGFNEVAERQRETRQAVGKVAVGRPGDDFDSRADWRSILEPHGWHAVRSRGDRIYWRRPGKKDSGISATTGFVLDRQGLYVFSSNAPPFDAGRAYSKFSAYGLLSHGGDYATAARAVSRMGYGEKQQKTEAPKTKSAAPPQRPLSEELDEALDDDKGAALEPAMFARMMAVRASDKAEWARVDAICKRHKITMPLREAIRDYDRKARSSEERRKIAPDETALRDALTCFGDIPVAGAPIVPPGYIIRSDVRRGEDRLFRLSFNQKGTEIEIPVCDRVPVISAVLAHRDGREFTECVWPSRMGKGWTRRPVPIADAAKLVDVCRDFGFPGTSNTRKDIVGWLDAYYKANKTQIEHRKINDQCGHQDSGGFLLGDRYLPAGDEEPVTFLAAGAGESQIVRDLRSAGTHQGWLDAIAVTREFPKLELALYASLAAPLLLPLGAASFAVEWAGATSSGKTTALRLAASVYGKPDEGGLIRNWAGTRIGTERYMSAMCDLPSILDDTQTARRGHGGKPQIVEDVLYQLAAGGCLRGDKEGTRDFQTWRTVLLSTGEQSIADSVQGGGAAARVLTLWGSPLEGVHPEVVRDLARGIAANFGHAGERWAEYVIGHRDSWPQWRALHAELHGTYRHQLRNLPDQGVAGRQAACMAVLGVAARLAPAAIGLPWDNLKADPIAACVDGFGQELEQISRPRQALEDLGSYVSARLGQVRGSDESEAQKEREPSDGWIGQIMPEHLAVYAEPLRTILERLGYQAKGIIRQWSDLGIIDRGSEGARTRLRVRSGLVASGYKIPLDTMADAGLDLRPNQRPLAVSSQAPF
jgi:hypothetical protein